MVGFCIRFWKNYQFDPFFVHNVHQGIQFCKFICAIEQTQGKGIPICASKIFQKRKNFRGNLRYIKRVYCMLLEAWSKHEITIKPNVFNVQLFLRMYLYSHVSYMWHIRRHTNNFIVFLCIWYMFVY